MTEATFQSQYNVWKKHNFLITCAEELKIVKCDRFYLNQIEPHQLVNLHNAKHGFFQFKIPDLGAQCPFDSFSLCNVPAYIVVLFYKPRQLKEFYIIDIDNINSCIEQGKKSLTKAECINLAEKIGILK